jgi:hypothetical protein
MDKIIQFMKFKLLKDIELIEKKVLFMILNSRFIRRHFNSRKMLEYALLLKLWLIKMQF